MKLFTVTEACDISGANPQTLRNWLTLGVLTPTQPGTTGTGRGHRFGLVQVVALASGIRHRDAGADAARVYGVVRLLAGMTWEQLEAEVEAGRTHVCPDTLLGELRRPVCWLPGMLVEVNTADPDLTPKARALLAKLDLKATMAAVKAKAAKMVVAELTA